MTNPRCKYYDSCEAPLCPLDEESLKFGIWYPDEEICHLRKLQKLDWIKKQKKLIEMGADPNFYFDVKMLQKIKRVSSKTKGKDPDAGILRR